MTEPEERQKRASALLDYQESKQTLALLKRDAIKFAEQLDGISKLLRESPRRIDREDGYLPAYAEILALAKKIGSAEIQTSELHQLVKNLGLQVD